MPSSFLRHAILSGLLAATACSGGGGSSGDGLAAITQNSAPAIAAAAMLGCDLSAEAADLAERSLPDMQMQQAVKLEAPSRGGLEAPTLATSAPFGPDMENCTVDGDVTFSGDIADAGGTYAAGDTVTAAYDLCDEGAEGMLDGSIAITIMSLVGDILGAAFDATLDLVVTQLALTLQDTFTFDGDGVLDIDTTVAGVTDTTLAGSRLKVDDGSVFVTLRDYMTSLVLDESVDPADYTLSANGRLGSSSFPGEVTYQTTQDFMGSGDAHPDSGVMRITGASATMWLIAVDATNVDLEIDLNGDGSVDALIQTTWDALGL